MRINMYRGMRTNVGIVELNPCMPILAIALDTDDIESDSYDGRILRCVRRRRRGATRRAAAGERVEVNGVLHRQ